MKSDAANASTITYREVFRNGNWIRLWLGQTLSQLGDFVSDIALPLLVFEITRSPIGLGLSFIVEALPIIFFGPIAGVLADRINRRSLLLFADLVRIFCALGMFLSNSLWQLYALALIAAVMQTLFFTTYAAVIPQITEKKFTKSISLSYMGYNTMKVIGPMVAAVIIGLSHGARAAFIFDAVTFSAGFLMTLTIHVDNVEQKAEKQHFLSEIRSGALFIKKSPPLIYITIYSTIIGIATAAATLGIVLYIKTALSLNSTSSDQLYGLVGAVLAGSLAFTTWLISVLDHRVPKRLLVLYGPFIAGLAYLLFLLRPGPGLVLPVCLLVSVGTACSQVPLLAFLAKAVPNEIRGRVYSFYNSITSVSDLAAYGLFSVIGVALLPHFLLAIAGCILIAGIISCNLILNGSNILKEQERPEQPQQTEQPKIAQVTAPSKE